MRCPTCRYENADAARYCEACGVKLARACRACGQEVGPQARFCSACGASLAEARDRHDPASRAEESASGERRQLTVLFCDLVRRRSSARPTKGVSPRAAAARGGMVHAYEGDADSVAEHVEALAPLASEHGFPIFEGTAALMRGWVLAERGAPAEGATLLREGLALSLATGARSNRPTFLGWLAQSQMRVGALAEAEATLDEALASLPGSPSSQGDLLRLRADLLARQGAGLAAVEAAYRIAVETARRMGLRRAELSAATSLGRLFLAQGRAAEARELVAPLYEWFTEGFDVPALVEARALLDEPDRAP